MGLHAVQDFCAGDCGWLGRIGPAGPAGMFRVFVRDGFARNTTVCDATDVRLASRRCPCQGPLVFRALADVADGNGRGVHERDGVYARMIKT